jgi:hypothetical protein
MARVKSAFRYEELVYSRIRESLDAETWRITKDLPMGSVPVSKDALPSNPVV